MAIQQATVQTLTAEVRVLFVGSRQVTLSVFRQLDFIDQSRFEAFGRVNDGRENLVMVGRDTQTGALARCEPKPVNWLVPLVAPEEFGHWLYHLEPENRVRHQWLGDRPYMAMGWQLRWWLSKFECGLHPRAFSLLLDRQAEPPQGNCGEDTELLHNVWKVIAELDRGALLAQETTYRQMAEMPLIVLAGLR